jgi:hypothetical protein
VCLTGKAFALHVQGPGLDPHHCKSKTKQKLKIKMQTSLFPPLGTKNTMPKTYKNFISYKTNKQKATKY